MSAVAAAPPQKKRKLSSGHYSASLSQYSQCSFTFLPAAVRPATKYICNTKQLEVCGEKKEKLDHGTKNGVVVVEELGLDSVSSAPTIKQTNGSGIFYF